MEREGAEQNRSCSPLLDGEGSRSSREGGGERKQKRYTLLAFPPTEESNLVGGSIPALTE